jgi:hypothetical protein
MLIIVVILVGPEVDEKQWIGTRVGIRYDSFSAEVQTELY